MQLMHSRWPIFAALLLGVGAVAVMWYAVLADPSGETLPASGGRYVEGVTQAPERINPLYATLNPTDADLSALVFSGLVRLGADGTPLPDLAERWEITGNGTQYVFHLRDGVAWHDDPEQRFDVDDVVTTFAALTDPEFRGDQSLPQFMRGVVVSARDARTVEFKLEEPYAPFLSQLTLGILPAHIIGDLNADDLYNAEFNALPVGTGPYRVVGRTRDGAVLEANSTYHFGPPHVSMLEVRVLSDPSQLVDALRDGDIDGALFAPTASDAQVELLEDDDRFALHTLPSTAANVIYLDTRLPVFADVAVRGALVQAVNQQAVIDEVAGGRGRPTDTGIPRESWAHADVPGRGFSPGDAARALELAGWARASDGIRRNSGVRLSFTLSAPNEPARVAMAENVARQLRAVGAEVEVIPIESATFVEDHLLRRSFQAALVEIDPGADPDPYPFWHSSATAPPWRNLSGFSDPDLDDALQRARLTADIARRKELYEDFASFVIGGAPFIPLFTPHWTYVQRRELRGSETHLLASPAQRFGNVHEWFIRTRTKQ